MPAPRAPAALIIRGALLTDPTLRRAQPADILVIDGVIAAIGPPGLTAPGDATPFDATNTVVHPGLINAHMHSHGGLARGQGDKWTLELLLAAAPWLGGGAQRVRQGVEQAGDGLVERQVGDHRSDDGAQPDLGIGLRDRVHAFAGW